jgi:hypothetical protein
MIGAAIWVCDLRKISKHADKPDPHPIKAKLSFQKYNKTSNGCLLS